LAQLGGPSSATEMVTASQQTYWYTGDMGRYYGIFCGKNVDIQLLGFNQEEWCFNQRDCWHGDIKQDDTV
jgi:hypothetical protein